MTTAPDLTGDSRPLAAIPWSVGSATGVGSMPGDDPGEAMRIVVGELDRFPHLIELPGAGPGGGLVGRGAAHLAGLHVEIQPSGWRFAAHPGADERRARSLLVRDLDALEEHTQAFVGPLKIQVAGPWTLAASIETRSGNKALADPGAVRDLTAALAQGVAEVAADVVKRTPGAQVVVQFDEPVLPSVLEGRVPTASGFGTLRAVDTFTVIDRLREMVDAVVAVGAVPIAHCCAASPPVDLFVTAGMRAVSVDATVLNRRDDDEFGRAIESGVGFFLGLVPPVDVEPLPSIGELVGPARQLWSRLGFPPERLSHEVVVTPTCGLAGASPHWPAIAYRACREAATMLLEAPEERA